MKTYTKPPLTFVQQIHLLKSRGLIFLDESKALHRLSSISYYRLSAYMLPYKYRDGKNIIDTFLPGSAFENVYRLYVFDRKLRLLVFDAIERIEIALRTQIIYQLSHKYGSHWPDNPSIFVVTTQIRRDGTTVTSDIYHDIQHYISCQLQSNNAELFIKHYKYTYDNPVSPPSWMSVETMYFNHLSRICSGLKQRSDLSGIAGYFDLPPKVFCSWLHNLNYIRNLCAHHGRLWNREMNIIPERLAFSKHRIWLTAPSTVLQNRSYYVLCILNYLLQTVNPVGLFSKRLKKLLAEYADVVDVTEMGFPKDWEDEALWK